MTDDLPTRDELALAQEREQRYKDMMLMRELDICPRYIVDDPLYEINVRYVQYASQMNAYSLEFRALQAIQDFNRYLMPLQVIKRGKKPRLDTSKPVAIIHGKPVFVDLSNKLNVFSYKE